MIERLGMNPDRVNYKRFKEACLLKDISIDNLAAIGKTRPRSRKIKPIEDLLCEHSRVHRVNFKRRLIKARILEEKCQMCGLGTVWNGEPLVLVLDHIDGVNDNYTLNNLRLLCPNCNSQTKTFAGRNIKVFAQPKPKCYECGRVVSVKGVRCIECSAKRREKIKWPHIDALREMIEKTNKSDVARQLGVSEMAIRKRLKMADRSTVGLGTLDAEMVLGSNPPPPSSI